VLLRRIKSSGLQGSSELYNSHLSHSVWKGETRACRSPTSSSGLSPSSDPKTIMSSPIETSLLLLKMNIRLTPKLISWDGSENYGQRSPGKCFWKDLSATQTWTCGNSTSISSSTFLKDDQEGSKVSWVTSVFNHRICMRLGQIFTKQGHTNLFFSH